MTPCILTFSGRMVNPLDAKPSDICIEDVAHALSLVNRYTGHTKRAYSVAQHSLACVELAWRFGLSVEVRLAALLHDATEAYLNDIAAPLKQSAIFEGYRRAEDVLHAVIWEALAPGRDWLVRKEAVRELDVRMLEAERRALLRPHADWVVVEYDEPADRSFVWVDHLPAMAAEQLFLQRYRELRVDL